MRCQDENRTEGEEKKTKKHGTILVVSSPKLVLKGVSLLSFGFGLPALIFFIKSSLFRIRSCKSSELIPSFMKLYSYSDFVYFMHTLKLGMKRGLGGQTRGPKTG